MHIPDGFLSAGVAVSTGVAALGVNAVALARAERTLEERHVPLLGVVAAFIFAAQMLNFPVAAGTSGHFGGGALAAILLGPLNACVVMTVVLTIQCLVFADGGLTALGANIVNLGIVGAFSGYYVFYALHRLAGGRAGGYLLAGGVGAFVSIVAASATCALMLIASGVAPAALTLPAMVGVHALIGLGEALITTAVLAQIRAVRPDLLAWGEARA